MNLIKAVRGDMNRVIGSLRAGQRKFRAPVAAQIQLLRVFAIVERLDLFNSSGCLLALKFFLNQSVLVQGP